MFMLILKLPILLVVHDATNLSLKCKVVFKTTIQSLFANLSDCPLGHVELSADRKQVRLVLVAEVSVDLSDAHFIDDSIGKNYFCHNVCRFKS